MFRFFNLDIFDFELIWFFGSIVVGGCDICEFLIVIGKIKKYDVELWYSVWKE